MSDPGYSFDPDEEHRVAEWEADPSRYATEAQWARIQANRRPPLEGELQFRSRFAQAERCASCGRPLIFGQPGQHYSCRG